MTKNQKIWFAVFLAMFLVPEVLWGGIIGKFIYYWVLGNSVNNGVIGFHLLPMPQSANTVKFIYLTEFIGALLSFIYSIIYYHPKHKLLKFLILTIQVLVLLVALYYSIFANSFSNISIG